MNNQPHSTASGRFVPKLDWVAIEKDVRLKKSGPEIAKAHGIGYGSLRTLMRYRRLTGASKLFLARAGRGRRGHPWSREARERKAAQPKPAALDRGTAAAQRKAYAAPEAHREADDWSVRDPEGRTHRVRNLRRWLIVRLGDEQAGKVYAGLRQVRRSLAGKTKRKVGSAHGWTLSPTLDPRLAATLEPITARTGKTKKDKQNEQQSKNRRG